jgi:hypothetical protein
MPPRDVLGLLQDVLDAAGFMRSRANGARTLCYRPGDLNFDGIVNAADLTILLNGWGSSGADINGDGTTNAADLSILLSNWG